MVCDARPAVWRADRVSKTRRRGDKETGRQGDGETSFVLPWRLTPTPGFRRGLLHSEPFTSCFAGDYCWALCSSPR